jgi:hypothetical protein
MNRCRLIYKSVAKADIPSNSEIRAIADKASSNNQKNGISGLRLLTSNRFLQVLEGPYREVNALFGTIMRDSRHHQIELITFEPLETHYFDTWHMRLVDLYDLPSAPRELLANKYPHQDGNILIPDNLHEVYALLLDARAVCAMADSVSKRSSSEPTGHAL